MCCLYQNSNPGPSIPLPSRYTDYATLSQINGCVEEKLVECVLDARCTVVGYFLFMSKLAETETTLRGL
jgi:hypothetical protein